MPTYTEFMKRHGECGVQAIVERLERYEGVRSNGVVPLEQRWNALMQTDASSVASEQMNLAA